MTHEEQLSNKLYRNWVRAALGLKYLKEGVVDLVKIEVESLHRTFLNDIENSLGSKNVACGQCTTANVVPCRTKGICVIRKGGKCDFHKSNDPSKCYRQCPNQICDKIFDKIVAEHRYGSPSWKNTDATKWCAEPWEIAKCFMAESGYKDKATAMETDCSGILSVMINARFMQNVLSAQINPPTQSNPSTDIVSKNRLARNDIMHSATLEVTDDRLGQYIDDMIALLKDNKQLVHNQEAIKVTQKLIKLKTDQVSITTLDELDVRKDVLNAIHEKKREALNDIENIFLEKKNEAIHAVDTHASDRLLAADAKLLATRDTLSAHLEAIADNCDTIMEAKLENALQEYLAVLEQTKCDFQQHIFEQVTRILKDLQTERNLSEIHHKRVEWIQSYHLRKEKLQKGLREKYKKHRSFVPISPLLKSMNESIDTIFTQLVIYDDLVYDPSQRKNTKVNESYVQKRTELQTYKDIFYKDDILCKSIYVLGDAGMGKTTWCLRLVNTWTTSLEKIGRHLTLDPNETVMSEYEFVFFINLRLAKMHGHVLHMIEEQMFERKIDEDLVEITLEVLKQEPARCLIVLDGLDEWSMPVAQTTQMDESGLPGRNGIYNCTVITTSRSWKLESLCLNRLQEIDRAVEIKGLNNEGIMNLANGIVNGLNKLTGETKQSKEFEDLTKKTHLLRLMSVPLLLSFLVCLWYEDDSILIDGTLASLYSRLIEILIKYAEDCKKLSDEMKTSLSQSKYNLPECLSNRRPCKEYGSLLLNIGKLAFQGLFSPDKKSCLVFTPESINEYLSDSEREIALTIGLLSQSETTGRFVLSRKFSLSFLHSTLQEYLASVYMISGDETQQSDSLNTYKLYCKSSKKVLEMENILLFVSGMCPSVAGEMTAHVSYVCPYGNIYLSKLLSSCMMEECMVSPDSFHIYNNQTFTVVSANLLYGYFRKLRLTEEHCTDTD